MVVVREIATIVHRTDTCISLQLSTHLIPGSLDGLDTWSHCWLLYGPGNLHPFRIEGINGKRLDLSFVDDDFPLNPIIIDIKPIHYVDI